MKRKYMNSDREPELTTLISEWLVAQLYKSKQGHVLPQGRTQRGLGLTPPLELDILQKLHYLCKGD